jgi:hypothetical protein
LFLPTLDYLSSDTIIVLDCCGVLFLSKNATKPFSYIQIVNHNHHYLR